MTNQKKIENSKPTTDKVEELAQENSELTVVTQTESNALQIVGRKTANDVFEKLEQGNRMREGYNRFKEKLDVCEKFATGYNNEALIMNIKNVGTGEELEIQNINLILDFVQDKLVSAGKNHLRQLEEQIVSFAL
jgi:hypothetical protein